MPAANHLPEWLPLTPATIEWIGAIAAALTTASFLPQVWLTFRTRDVSGISLGMYSCFTTGVALWLVYGLSIGSVPVTVANVITLTFATVILAMKIRYGRRPADQNCS
ncbi:SemiSWEET family sugar transporter [Aquabacterium parvum]|jgi:MtN3 and saliva related transmembrane protein|uniref:SemiSWEET family sugar transporter n=1 Tax=Aquabacterium parvum TaxID=70584 RepID=UPI000718C5CD|nr:SemiSWEET transporter [Aquabacterium parvum]MBU0917278.1 SemiSWEET transporter [Gammaproteobacteria bacterium]